MTVHAAKRIGIPTRIPMCIKMKEFFFLPRKTSTIEGMEEERRLAFVAMSRAMKSLFFK